MFILYKGLANRVNTNLVFLNHTLCLNRSIVVMVGCATMKAGRLRRCLMGAPALQNLRIRYSDGRRKVLREFLSEIRS